MYISWQRKFGRLITSQLGQEVIVSDLLYIRLSHFFSLELNWIIFKLSTCFFSSSSSHNQDGYSSSFLARGSLPDFFMWRFNGVPSGTLEIFKGAAAAAGLGAAFLAISDELSKRLVKSLSIVSMKGWIILLLQTFSQHKSIFQKHFFLLYMSDVRMPSAIRSSVHHIQQ